MTDNPQHLHAYRVMGTGLSCWAQCECGAKLVGDNGVIVGSRQKVAAAISR